MGTTELEGVGDSISTPVHNFISQAGLHLFPHTVLFVKLGLNYDYTTQSMFHRSVPQVFYQCLDL